MHARSLARWHTLELDMHTFRRCTQKSTAVQEFVPVPMHTRICRSRLESLMGAYGLKAVDQGAQSFHGRATSYSTADKSDGICDDFSAMQRTELAGPVPSHV